MVMSVIGSLDRQYAAQQYGESHQRRQPQREGRSFTGLPHAPDQVELSPQAPQPFTVEELSRLREDGHALQAGESLSAASIRRLRQSRVHVAVLALDALGASPDGWPRRWPPGLPRPTAQELEAAYRRLAQRVHHDTSGVGPDRVEAVRQWRTGLVDRHRMTDFPHAARQLADLT